MAEALGLTSSIVALVQLSASVYSATSKFYKEAKEAKSRISALATQTRNLSGVLQSLSLLASSPLFDDAGVSVPDFRDTYIESCHNTLYKIKRKLDKAEGDVESGSQKRVIKRSLKWPFASQETNDLVKELSQHRDVLQLALSSETMSHLLQCLSNTNSIAKSVDHLNRKLERKDSIDTRSELTAKRKEVIRFFLKVNPEEYLQDCRSQRQPHTGRWLIKRDQTFRDWIGALGSHIWLSGIPGAGKTILCGTVVEEILQEQKTSTAVAFFFCDYKNKLSQDPVNILAALAVQLAKQGDAAFDVLEGYHNDLHPPDRLPMPPERKRIIQVVKKMIDQYDRVYLAVDGLDECGSNVVEVLQSLKQLADGIQVNMALFSRDEPDIMEELSDSRRIEIAAHTEDLELYVLAEMERQSTLKSLAVRNPKLHEHIRRTLIQGANGMFRWAACQLDHLGSLPNDRRREQALTQLPPTLFETYDRILDRIMKEDEEDREVCRKALHWIGLGFKEIEPRALCEAISFPSDLRIFNNEHLVEPEWISRRCSSLIRLAHHGSGQSHFQFAHFTVKEYLRSIKHQSERSIFRFSEDVAIRLMLATSLRFLTLPTFDRQPTIVSTELDWMRERNRKHPFYPIAASYMFCRPGLDSSWEQKLIEQLSVMLEDARMMTHARELFSPEKKGVFLSWVLEFMVSQAEARHRLNHREFFNCIGLIFAPGFSTLHVAAMLAIPSLCAFLVENPGVDINVCCQVGTPLHALLAGPDILSDTDFNYHSFLHRRKCMSSGLDSLELPKRCLEILLQTGVDTSLRWGATSILEMAINNSDHIAYDKLWIHPLINRTTEVSETFIEVFRKKLARGALERSTLIAIFTLGSSRNTSPGWARLASLIQTRTMNDGCNYSRGNIPTDLRSIISDEDFLDAIRISLQNNLTSQLKSLVQDPRFRTDMYMHSQSIPILHFATLESSPKCVELLLDAGCDPNVVDVRDGWTSLHQCALRHMNDASFTTLLVKAGAIDSLTDKLGETCWHVAAREGNVSVLRLLIDMSSDTKKVLATTSNAGRTPLGSAIHGGKVESAMILLDHCGPELKFLESDQPLLDAAAAIGSKDLFLGLYDRLKEADATKTIESSKPLDKIRMCCSLELVDYLLSSWKRHDDSTSLVNFLLQVDDHTSRHWDSNPSRTELNHVIGGLLPPDHVFGDHGKTQEHFWDTFCKTVVPDFLENRLGINNPRRAELIVMIFEILIDNGVMASYEGTQPRWAYKAFFQALLSQKHYFSHPWIAPAVHRVIEGHSHSLSDDLSSNAICIELLSRCVQKSQIKLARELLDHGVNVHSVSGSLSPLEHACSTSNLQMFHLILSRSTSSLINEAGSQGKTLLHWVVAGNGQDSAAKINRLVQLGANIDAVVDDPTGDTALTMACRRGRRGLFALLVSKGASTLHRAHDGWTVLHAAATAGHIGYIDRLIHSDVPVSFWRGVCTFPLVELDGRPQRVQDSTAIHLAARKGHSHLLKHLIKKQIPFDVNAVTKYPMLTPLHLAALFGHPQVVDILVSSKANINARDAFGRLPIELAAQASHLKIVIKLLKSGSETPSGRFGDLIARLTHREVEFVKNAGDLGTMAQFSFETAIVHGNLGMCQNLASRGQSVNAELLSRSYTPLVLAVVERQTHIVDWLVSAGVDVTSSAVGRVHPSLRCIASLTTHYIKSTETIVSVMNLALKQNLSWYGSILSPLHIAVLDNKVEALDSILKHILQNRHRYRNLIEKELIRLPAATTTWRERSALSILVNELNHESALSNNPPWSQRMPPGSPLHWAIRKSNLSTVKLLLQNEAAMNQPDSLGFTPLCLAVSSKQPAKLLRVLLQAGAGLEEPSRCRLDNMRLAIRIGDLEVVKLLAEADPESLKAVDQFSANNLLHVAGSVEVFQYLISQGNDSLNSNFNKSSAVTFQMNKALLSGFIFNSGLASQSAEEPTAIALSTAADLGNLCLIRKLYHALPIKKFAALVNRTKHGIASALCLAASKNAAKLAEILLHMGAELELEGCRYGSALMAACNWGCLDVVKCLVRSGAALYYVNEEGLLRSAVNLSSRHQKVMRWLLVDRHMEQQKLEHQPSKYTYQQGVWSGPRLFKLALPAYMHRDFGESRWSHLRRLQKWKEGLLGSTLAESRRNSGLDFEAELDVESRTNEAKAVRHRFLARLGEQ